MKFSSKEHSSCSKAYPPRRQRPPAPMSPYPSNGYLCSWTVVQPEPDIQTQRALAVHMRATVLNDHDDNEKGR
jgi:hypothetical protein